MIDSKKLLKLQQKETIVDFIIDCIKNGKKFEMRNNDTILITMNGIEYSTHMGFVYSEKIFNFRVFNRQKNLIISFEASDIKDVSKISFITNYILSIQEKIDDEFTDDEFGSITNLTTNTDFDRARKITHIKEKIKKKNSLWNRYSRIFQKEKK